MHKDFQGLLNFAFFISRKNKYLQQTVEKSFEKRAFRRLDSEGS